MSVMQSGREYYLTRSEVTIPLGLDNLSLSDTRITMRIHKCMFNVMVT